MKKQLTDPHDFEMLRCVLAAREFPTLCCLCSPFYEDAAERKLADSSFTVGYPNGVFSTSSFDSFFGVFVGADGFIQVADNGLSRDMQSRFNPGRECTDRIIRSSVLRFIKEVEKSEAVEEDTPFWPMSCAHRSHILSFEDMAELKIEMMKQIHDSLSEFSSIYWKISPEWVDAHPFTLRQLRAFADKFTAEQRDEVFKEEAENVLVAEKRRLLINLAGVLKNSVMVLEEAKEFSAEVSDALFECLALLSDPSITELKYKQECKKILDSFILSGYALKNCSVPHPSDDAYIKLWKKTKKLIGTTTWKAPSDAVRMLSTDPGLPDIRYFLRLALAA